MPGNDGRKGWVVDMTAVSYTHLDVYKRQVLIQFFKITVDQLVCFWKTLLCHEIFSVIHDRYMETKHFSQMSSRLGYVTAAKDHKPWILAVI